MSSVPKQKGLHDSIKEWFELNTVKKTVSFGTNINLVTGDKTVEYDEGQLTASEKAAFSLFLSGLL